VRILALVLALCICGPTFAQDVAQPKTYCMPRQAILQTLIVASGERLIGRGVDARGQLIEVYGRDGGGPWTVIVTRKDQISCVLAAGRDGWETMEGPEL